MQVQHSYTSPRQSIIIWLDFTSSPSHAFRYERQNRQNPDFARIERTHDFRTLNSKCARSSTRLLINRPLGRRVLYVCVFSSHPFWTSSSLDVPAGVTQEEGHTGFLIHLPSAVCALIFVARRIQPFLSLVDREVEFCVLTN